MAVPALGILARVHRSLRDIRRLSAGLGSNGPTYRQPDLRVVCKAITRAADIFPGGWGISLSSGHPESWGSTYGSPFDSMAGVWLRRAQCNRHADLPRGCCHVFCD